MAKAAADSIITTLRAATQPLSERPAAYTPLLEAIGDARFVLLGEASHGTHEFYYERTQITKRLILEKGLVLVGFRTYQGAVTAASDWASRG